MSNPDLFPYLIHESKTELEFCPGSGKNEKGVSCLRKTFKHFGW